MQCGAVGALRLMTWNAGRVSSGDALGLPLTNHARLAQDVDSSEFLSEAEGARERKRDRIHPSPSLGHLPWLASQTSLGLTFNHAHRMTACKKRCTPTCTSKLKHLYEHVLEHGQIRETESMGLWFCDF